MNRADWMFPGSRWWKFDFHTHTPASKDTRGWQNAIGTPDELTPETWLLKYMAAEVDCVAVTDHNSGEWIDRLKSSYVTMKEDDELGIAPEGFRELTVFPGVEMSVNGGIHLLAIFGPEATTRTITDLLAQVGYQGTDGDSDGVTKDSIEEVVRKVLDAGGIPIPAHADQEKGLLQRRGESAAPQLNASTIQQALAVEGLLAVEWCNSAISFPECVHGEESRFSKVLGSDCHSFRGSGGPGSRFTWVKMASPSFEGLRLALLDGNGISVRRSDDPEPFDPFHIPKHIITSIEISAARYMGNKEPARLPLSPYFNAVVGGRGTGKSTLLHSMRLATDRNREVLSLGQDSEPRVQFESFKKASKGRGDSGALREDTAICLEWLHDDQRLKLRWASGGQEHVVEEWNGAQWNRSASQSINAARFPVRIFSQGQIAALAGSGRQALLSIIDEAAGVGQLQQDLEEAQSGFLALRARVRELDSKLANEPEARRKLEEASRKLAVLAQTDQASVLHGYAQAKQQIQAVNSLPEQLDKSISELRGSAENLVLNSWSGEAFTEADADILSLRQGLDSQVQEIQERILEQVVRLSELLPAMYQDAGYAQWYKRVQAAEQAYSELQQQFEAQGVSDPQAFSRLTQEKQQLEEQCKQFESMRRQRLELLQKTEEKAALLLEKRQAISFSRTDFIRQTLSNNDYVRIEVRPFGSEAKNIERELRALIEVQDERFADDILAYDADEPTGGLAWKLAQGGSEEDKLLVLEHVRSSLISTEGLGGHFRKFLQKRHEKPELADHILTWFPEDDLKIEYQRERRWYPISSGSQGQRSATLLAFLLAFGDEPIILDQPEDDLDNHLIYDLIVQQIRENKLRRQLIIITHNPNVVVNGDAELVHVMEFGRGQCIVQGSGALQEKTVRTEVCRVMEGGREAFSRRWKRLGADV